MTSNERIQEALSKVGWSTPDEIVLHQAAFNFLKAMESSKSGWVTHHPTTKRIRWALDRWADIVLGLEENGNGQWADDGGSNL